jgi:hypothetical protein
MADAGRSRGARTTAKRASAKRAPTRTTVKTSSAGRKAAPSGRKAAATRPALRVVRTPERPRRDTAAASRHSIALLLIPAALLTVLGLAMILSAGSISAVEGYGTSFWYFQRQ